MHFQGKTVHFFLKNEALISESDKYIRKLIPNSYGFCFLTLNYMLKNFFYKILIVKNAITKLFGIKTLYEQNFQEKHPLKQQYFNKKIFFSIFFNITSTSILVYAIYVFLFLFIFSISLF